MKVSDEIMFAINEYRKMNTWFVPSKFREGEGGLVEHHKKPKRIYLGDSQLKRMLKDRECKNYYHMELNVNKRDTVFGLELYLVSESDHIFVA
jgi:hypothetical protein